MVGLQHTTRGVGKVVPSHPCTACIRIRLCMPSKKVGGNGICMGKEERGGAMWNGGRSADIDMATGLGFCVDF